jgi:hypothetical protein
METPLTVCFFLLSIDKAYRRESDAEFMQENMMKIYCAYPDESVEALDEALLHFLRFRGSCKTHGHLALLRGTLLVAFPFFLKCKRFPVLFQMCVDDIRRKTPCQETHVWCTLLDNKSILVPHPLDVFLPDICVERVRFFSSGRC